MATDKNKDKIKTENTSIKYAGEVTTKLIRGNKIVAVKKHKNNGRWPLFYFITSCIAGNYKEIESYRPKYIKLYNIDQIYNPDNLSFSEANKTKLSLVDFIYSSNPEVSFEYEGNTTTKNDKTKSNVTFKFLIPLSQVKRQQVNNGYLPINLLGLYSTAELEISSDKNEPSAYCYILNNSNALDTTEGLINWSTITGDLNSYSVLVEWTLKISNK